MNRFSQNTKAHEHEREATYIRLCLLLFPKTHENAARKNGFNEIRFFRHFFFCYCTEFNEYEDLFLQ